ncbi:hypothetical protein JTB14_016364 [Gonioctena quinquepunctata]|nr:hypothetical protein JTB14_016364 [Gonioctena quinquepunctata]
MGNKILPPMRFDELGRLVRNEDLIILFGNILTQKYCYPHLHKMIRSRLRCVANFYWHYQQRNPQVKNLEDVFDPQNYDEVVTSINKMAGLNKKLGSIKHLQLQQILPHIRKKYLHTSYKVFSIIVWKELAGALLIALQLFNRRRAGEIERTKIQDFQQNEAVNVHDEMACDLEGDHNENYVRFLIRGKRERDVPVLADKYKLKCLNLISKYRDMAGTPITNPHVFGIPVKDSGQHLNAYKLISSYASACGAENPERLRGTQLREHFAMNLREVDSKDVADYMGHHDKIHLEHYRIPNATRVIVRMSRILEKAQGVENSSTSSRLNHSCNDEMIEAKKQDGLY